jgi:arylsulfatase A-like enzyme
MTIGERAGWRSLVPPRSGWLRLLTAFSSYLLVFGALATVVGKAVAMELIEGVDHPVWLLAWAVSQDLLVYLGLAALLAAIEMRARRARLLTWPLAIGAAITALLNMGYLVVTGEQATFEAFLQLFARIGDVSDIAGEVLTFELVVGIPGGLLLAVVLPLWLRRRLLRRGWYFEPRFDGRERLLCAGWVAALSLVIVAATPRPQTVMARNLGKNALYATLRTLTHFESGTFTAYEPARLVSAEALERFAAVRHPNVLVLVLESTRHDRTALSGRKDAAATPTLAKLAKKGLYAPRARAVLPHTTKSLFSILCGRFPLMQKQLVETSADLDAQCLPAILAEAGYRTGFFQSSWGTFESRPRLAERLGFTDFRAWEDIGGQPLGYLASDDESLVEPFAKWLDQLDPQQPFMATLLTSATHHPYRLSKRAKKAAKAADLPVTTPEERYLRLLEAQDRLLAGIIKQLDRRRLRKNTIIVVLGDHGEGFGEKGVKQHDNNYYEEGLRVPLVFFGPRVPVREVPGNASLVDVTPTLLALLGLSLPPEAQRVMDGQNLADRSFTGQLPRYFSCWFESRCRGFVLGDYKVIHEPQTDESWYYDLAADPEENKPLVLGADLNADLAQLETTLERFRARNYPVVWGATSFGEWRCEAEDRDCRHPNAKKEKFRYPRSEAPAAASPIAAPPAIAAPGAPSPATAH